MLFICVTMLNAQTDENYVDGELITFTENGNWCWFQDERAVVDTAENKLVIGSAAKGGAVDVVIYDLSKKKVESKTQIGKLSSDDHNAPAAVMNVALCQQPPSLEMTRSGSGINV